MSHVLGGQRTSVSTTMQNVKDQGDRPSVNVLIHTSIKMENAVSNALPCYLSRAVYSPSSLRSCEGGPGLVPKLLGLSGYVWKI